MRKKLLSVLFIILMINLSVSFSIVYAQETTPDTTSQETTETQPTPVETPPESPPEAPPTTIQETQTQPEIQPEPTPQPESQSIPSVDTSNLPEGCAVEKGEFGEFVKCEDKFVDDFRERARAECKKFGGKFNIKDDGGTECVVEGRSGFTGTYCPNEDGLRKQAESCQGEVHSYNDANGCRALSCELEENFRDVINEQGIDPVKAHIIECQERDGEFIVTSEGPQCFETEEEIKVPEDLGAIEPEELLDIALKIEGIIIKLEQTADKIEDILEYYESKGNSERAKGFESALARLDGAIARLEEIKLGLSENADSVTKEQRKQIIIDIKSIKGIIKDVAVDILSGGKSKRGEMRGRGKFREEFEEFRREFRTTEEIGIPEVDFTRAYRNCDQFSKDDPFVFKPEPQVEVRLEGLDNGRCVMRMEAPFLGEIIFLLPPRIYQFFTGPHLLFEDDVECSPKESCKIMRDMFGHFKATGKERFGEREFKEKFKNGEFEREFREEFEEEDEFRERFGEESGKEEFKRRGIPSENFERFKEHGPSPEDFEKFGREQEEFYDQQRERFEEENKDENKDNFIIENALEKYGDEFREETK